MPQDTDKKPTGKLPEAERSFAGADKLAEHKARTATGEGKARARPAADDADTSDPHTERQLDHGLEETFPASDPVSISPGAD
jgi:hypothetical protein